MLISGFLLPGPRKKLLAKAVQISMHKVKMAMAVSGKNRLYRWNSITKRHWLDTAKKCRFPEGGMKQIIEK